MRPEPFTPESAPRSTGPLSVKTTEVLRESEADAATRAASSERLQAAGASPSLQRASDRRLDERTCVALSVAFALGVLVGFCAAPRR